MDLLGYLSATIDIGRKLHDLAKRAKQTEIEELVQGLREGLLESRQQAIELQQEVARLKAQIETRAAVELRDAAYWLTEPRPAGRAPGPYCTRCFDVDGKLVAAHPSKGQDRKQGAFRCPQCSASFGTPAPATVAPPPPPDETTPPRPD